MIKVRFTLTMHNVVVSGENVGTLIVDWLADADYEEVAAVSRAWLDSREDFAYQLTGLKEFSDLSLQMAHV